MKDVPDWQELSKSLRALHRALMERGTRDNEHEHQVVLGPGELVKMPATDP